MSIEGVLFSFSDTVIDLKRSLLEFLKIQAREFHPLLTVPLNLKPFLFALQEGDREKLEQAYKGVLQRRRKSFPSVHELTRHLLRHFPDHIVLTPSIERTLLDLSFHGYKVGVIAQGNKRIIDEIIERSALKDLIDSLTVYPTRRCLGAFTLLRAVKALDASPYKCFLVSSTGPLLEAADALNLQTAWLKRPRKSSPCVRVSGFDWAIESVAEMLGILLRIKRDPDLLIKDRWLDPQALGPVPSPCR